MRAARHAALATVVLVSAGQVTAATGTAASSAAGQDVPVAGTFAFDPSQFDTAERAVGVVHAVRRVPGGTMLHYSMGLPAGTPPALNFVGMFPRNNMGEAYQIKDAASVAVVDAAGLRAYLPVVGPDGCFCPSIDDFTGESGVLHTGYAFLPPLPPEVGAVDVIVGYGAVNDVPVQEGALEPVSGRRVQQDRPMPILGAGWQPAPDPAAVADIDMQRFVRDLVQVTGDLDRTETRTESPRRVEVGLSADVLFATDSAQLTAPARQRLADLATDIAARGRGEVTVVGHTDDTGASAYNLDLSRRRAQAVLDALRPAVGGSVALRGQGRGEAEPVGDNSTDAGRQLNRRVVVSYSLEED